MVSVTKGARSVRHQVLRLFAQGVCHQGVRRVSDTQTALNGLECLTPLRLPRLDEFFNYLRAALRMAFHEDWQAFLVYVLGEDPD